MAETADLVVLGGWFGSGQKGGMLSIFLMGCLDTESGLWKTVTKVHSGLDDATMEEMHNKLMDQMERSNAKQLPSWLICNEPLVPDYIAKSPDIMPVWEITGEEFTNSNEHTANGISIRFPRITKVLGDKSPKEATNMQQLEKLFTASKDNVNVDLLLGSCDDSKDIKIETSIAASTSKKIEFEKIEKEDDPESSPKEAAKTESTEVKRKNSDECEEELLSVQKEKKRKGDVFVGYIAFFRHNPGTQLDRYLRQFEEYGGEITLDKKKANIVLYESQKFVETIAESRRYYRAECRHATVDWISDSIIELKAKTIPKYAVQLKAY